MGMDFLGLLAEYRYWFIFAGMFVGGEAVLLPAIFLSLQGVLNPAAVIGISLAANFLSDSAWYSVGRFFPSERVTHLRAVARAQKLFSSLLNLFERHPWRIIFWSNFVYGTRILTQVISGLKRLPYPRYMSFNLLGVLAYQLFLFILALAVHQSLSQFAETVRYAKIIILAIFILVAILVNLWIRRVALKRWSPPSSPV